MHRTSAVIAALTLVAVTHVVGTADAEAITPSRPSSTDSADPALDRHIVGFRHSMGLATDASRMAAAQRAQNASEELFGVPLTDAEYRELAFRQTVVANDAALSRSAVLDRFGPERLAGVWMDNQEGGQLTVGVTGQVDAIYQFLAGRVHHPDRLTVRRMQSSMVELEKVARRIGVRAPEHMNLGISGVKVDERANVVRVLARHDPARVQDWLSSWLQTDAEVRVEQGAVTPVGTQYMDSPPFRGGQQIESLSYICTSGFVASGGGRDYVVTAGHCGRAGDAWTQVVHPIGVADRSDVTNTDAMRIPNGWYGTNEVTLSYDPDFGGYYRKITSSQSSANDAVGQISCITGKNFGGLRCGEIITRGYSVNISLEDGRTLTYTNGREVDADCNPGDSGGPALYGKQARGIISVKVTRFLANDTCVYVHIGPALNQLGLTDVRTTPGGIL